MATSQQSAAMLERIGTLEWDNMRLRLSTDLISLYHELFDHGLANSSPQKQGGLCLMAPPRDLCLSQEIFFEAKSNSVMKDFALSSLSSIVKCSLSLLEVLLSNKSCILNS
ncbi:hypothetical protein Tco_0612445 [Tanacetum coccineum]